MYRYIYIYIYLSIVLSIYLSIYPFIYLSIRIYIYIYAGKHELKIWSQKRCDDLEMYNGGAYCWKETNER